MSIDLYLSYSSHLTKEEEEFIDLNVKKNRIEFLLFLTIVANFLNLSKSEIKDSVSYFDNYYNQYSNQIEVAVSGDLSLDNLVLLRGGEGSKSGPGAKAKNDAARMAKSRSDSSSSTYSTPTYSTPTYSSSIDSSSIDSSSSYPTPLYSTPLYSTPLYPTPLYSTPSYSDPSSSGSSSSGSSFSGSSSSGSSFSGSSFSSSSSPDSTDSSSPDSGSSRSRTSTRDYSDTAKSKFSELIPSSVDEEFPRRRLFALLDQYNYGQMTTPRIIPHNPAMDNRPICHARSFMINPIHYSDGIDDSTGLSTNHRQFPEDLRTFEQKTELRRKDSVKIEGNSPLTKDLTLYSSPGHNNEKGPKHLTQFEKYHAKYATTDLVEALSPEEINKDARELQKFVLDNPKEVYRGTLNDQEDTIIILTDENNALHPRPIVSCYGDHPMYKNLHRNDHITTYPITVNAEGEFRKTVETGFIEIPAEYVEGSLSSRMTLELVHTSNGEIFKTRGPNVGEDRLTPQNNTDITQNQIDEMWADLERSIYPKIPVEARISGKQFREAKEKLDKLDKNMFPNLLEFDRSIETSRVISLYHRHIAATAILREEPDYKERAAEIKALEQQMKENNSDNLNPEL